MTSHVKFPWNSKLGNIGESEIKKRLSYFAQVTKDENDVGIDFICQLCVNDIPSGKYFLIQAKKERNISMNIGGKVLRQKQYSIG